MPFFKVYCVAFPEAAAGAAPAGDVVKPERPTSTEVAAAPRSANTASAGARPGFMADGPMVPAGPWQRVRRGRPHSGAAPVAWRRLHKARAARKPDPGL